MRARVDRQHIARRLDVAIELRQPPTMIAVADGANRIDGVGGELGHMPRHMLPKPT